MSDNCSRQHSEDFYFYCSKQIRFNISCELSVRERIHIKYQDLISLKKQQQQQKKQKQINDALPILILKEPIKTAAQHFYFFFNFSKKISLDIFCESSASR